MWYRKWLNQIGLTLLYTFIHPFIETECRASNNRVSAFLDLTRCNLFDISGPGCSSLGAGAFSEHGPFKPSDNILVKNDYSWNKGDTFFNLLDIKCAFRISLPNFWPHLSIVMNFLNVLLQRQTWYTWNHLPELASLILPINPTMNL